MFRSMFDIKNVNGIKNNNNSSIEQDFSRDVDGSDFKSSFPEGSAFRGFPESETSTFYSHVRNLQLDYLPGIVKCKISSSSSDFSRNFFIFFIYLTD